MGLTDTITLGNLHLSGSAVCGGWNTFGISGAPCGQPQCTASTACGILELLRYQMLVLSSEQVA